MINVRSLKRLERTASQPSSRRLIPLEEIKTTKLHFFRFFVRVPFVYLLVCLSQRILVEFINGELEVERIGDPVKYLSGIYVRVCI